jgi:hypothetical protein
MSQVATMPATGRIEVDGHVPQRFEEPPGAHEVRWH